MIPYNCNVVKICKQCSLIKHKILLKKFIYLSIYTIYHPKNISANLFTVTAVRYRFIPQNRHRLFLRCRLLPYYYHKSFFECRLVSVNRQNVLTCFRIPPFENNSIKSKSFTPMTSISEHRGIL